MTFLNTLTDTDRRVYEKILQPNASEPLVWGEVRSLFRALGRTAWQPNGDLAVTCNGHVLVLRPPLSREVSGPDEILELRRFLERSFEIPPQIEPPVLEPAMQA